MSDLIGSDGVKTAPKLDAGGRRLVFFGMVAILFAFLSSGVSLYIYAASGDIYLDRSRPGFISEGEGNDQNGGEIPVAAFSQNGPMNDEVVDEYIERLEAALDDIVRNNEAFSEEALSDKALNIDVSEVDASEEL